MSGITAANTEYKKIGQLSFAYQGHDAKIAGHCWGPGGYNYYHNDRRFQGYVFSYASCREFFSKLRWQQRFDSVENDRQEHMVDVLLDIDEKQREIRGSLSRIINQLSVIGESVTGGVVNGSVKKSAGGNISIGDGSSVNILPSLKEVTMVTSRSCDLQSKILATNQEMSASMNRNCSKLTTQLGGIRILDMAAKMENVQKELVQLKEDQKKELLAIKSEIQELKDAIVNVLPLKIAQAFHGVTGPKDSEECDQDKKSPRKQDVPNGSGTDGGDSEKAN